MNAAKNSTRTHTRGDSEKAQDLDSFHTGVTEYRRPSGLRGRRSNPYRNANMIYAKKKRRKWPIVVILLLLIAIVVIIAIVMAGCPSVPAA